MPGKGALEGAGGLPAGELLSGGCLYLPEGLLSCQARSRCVRGDGMPAPCVCPSLSGPGAAESESGVKGGGGSPTTANFRPDTRSKVWQPGKTAQGCCHSGHAPKHPSLQPSLPIPCWGLAVDAWADRRMHEWVGGAFLPILLGS